METDHPSCTYVPRQIPRNELLKLIPDTWLTSYEQNHQNSKNSQPIQSTTHHFRRNSKGQVEIMFKREPTQKKLPCFPTQHAFTKAEDNIPIYTFDSDGKPIYVQSHEGHIYWDVFFCKRCTKRTESDNRMIRSSQHKLQKEYEQKSPHVGLLGEPSGKFDYYVTYTPPPRTDDPIVPTGWTDDDDYDDHYQWHKKWDWSNPEPEPSPSFMFQSPLKDFPPLSNFDKGLSTHSWKVKNPTTRSPDGSVNQLSPAEKVLNWQSENAVQQNKLLQKIDQSQQRIEKAFQHQTQAFLSPLEACRQRIEEVTSEIMDLLSKRLPFDAQEGELRSLKHQLNFIENSSLIPPSSPFKPTYPQNISQSYGPMYSESSGSLKNFFSPEEWERKLKKPKPPKTQARSRVPPPNPEKQPQLMIKNPISEFLERAQKQETTSPPILAITADSSTSDSNPAEESESSRQSDSSYESSTRPPVYMENEGQTSREESNERPAEETEQVEPTIISEDEQSSPPTIPNVMGPSISTSSGSSVKFTLDDIPPIKWRSRFQEMQAWCSAELQKPLMTHTAVIKSFLARLTGFLRDWYDSLGEYRQLQYLNSPTVEQCMNALYWEFCGRQEHLKDIAREEFFKLKCCSYNPKDLDKHFQNAAKRYYLIGGMDDPNIKQAYLESIPQPLGQETLRMIEIKGQFLGTTSFGELHNMVLRTPKKLCNQRAFLTDIHSTGKKLEKACERPELKIKCHYNDKSCSCPGKKKRHIKKFKFKRKGPRSFPKKRRFFRRKFSKKKGDRYFICEKKGHFAKDCPEQKKAKILKQICAATNIDDEADLESIFSEEDEQSSNTIFVLEDRASDTDDSFSDPDECYGLQVINLSLSVPMVEIKIFPSKYDRPIIVAGLFDTGAACSILNPTILPSSTEIISKPVSIQFFPNCKISHRLLGSSLPGKDIVIDFDIIQQLWSKRVIPKYNGLQYKSHFLPYIRPTTYFSMTSIPSLKEKLIQDCCAESHTDFISKCTNPLWRNSEFFVSLPFKLNEDANPTKASHTGMSPDIFNLQLQNWLAYKPKDSLNPPILSGHVRHFMSTREQNKCGEK
ncbi:Reverse transcriptase domain-containing protein [Abeliophyllum distichum]|uniref:Reverse transcriptase domain-containing protein n=1 Tax=Abeliophyllum distichum TaxID=126358 RepID=A0ABD1QA20_9LAMI